MKLIDVFEGLMRVFWLWIWEVDIFLLDIFLVYLLKYVLIDIKNVIIVLLNLLRLKL